MLSRKMFTAIVYLGWTLLLAALQLSTCLASALMSFAMGETTLCAVFGSHTLSQYDVLMYWTCPLCPVLPAAGIVWLRKYRRHLRGDGSPMVPFWMPSLLLTLVIYSVTGLALALNIPEHGSFDSLAEQQSACMSVFTMPVLQGLALRWGAAFHLFYSAMWGVGLVTVFHLLLRVKTWISERKAGQ